jgi:hypothetical protein
VSALDSQVLADLFRGEACLAIVKAFASPAMCARITEYVRHRVTASPYTHEVYEHGQVQHVYFGVDRVGVPFNSTLTVVDTARAREHYYAEALPTIRRLRAAAAPELSPIDRLRLELDELWPRGAHIGSFEGRSMFVGIVRAMQPSRSEGSELHPHFDALPASVARFDGQFAANIFVSVPPAGGELEVWDVPPFEPTGELPDEWRLVGGEPVAVKPEVGDLILFNARKPHAIRRFSGCDRISVQTFIGYRQDGPLLLWN